MGGFFEFGGAMLGHAMGLDQQQLNREYNEQEAKRQRNWATSERENTQRWQEKMTDNAYQFARGMQAMQNQFTQSQVNQEREYNTPYAQAMRLNQIGLSANGQQMSAADSTFGVPQGVSVPSVPGGSITTGAAASAPPPNYTGIELGKLMMSGLQSIGAFTKDISQSDLNDAEKDRIYALLQGQVTSQELQNRLQSVNATVAEHTGLKKAWQDLQKGYAETLLLQGQEYESRMSALSKQSEAFLNDAKTLLSGQQYNQLVIDVLNSQRRYDDLHMLANSENAANRASAYASYKAGEKSVAETKTINDSREHIVATLKTDSQSALKKLDGLQLDNDIKIIESVDKMFGYDVGLGAQIKAYLIALAPNTRAKALQAIKDAIEGKNDVDAVSYGTTVQTSKY